MPNLLDLADKMYGQPHSYGRPGGGGLQLDVKKWAEDDLLHCPPAFISIVQGLTVPLEVVRMLMFVTVSTRLTVPH